MSAADRPLRVYLGAFGDPGHAFPMLALGEALRARGHAVALQTWRRWQEPAEAAGLEFAAAPEYQAFPTRERPLAPYQAAGVDPGAQAHDTPRRHRFGQRLARLYAYVTGHRTLHG